MQTRRLRPEEGDKRHQGRGAARSLSSRMAPTVDPGLSGKDVYVSFHSSLGQTQTLWAPLCARGPGGRGHPTCPHACADDSCRFHTPLALRDPHSTWPREGGAHAIRQLPRGAHQRGDSRGSASRSRATVPAAVHPAVGRVRRVSCRGSHTWDDFQDGCQVSHTEKRFPSRRSAIPGSKGKV